LSNATDLNKHACVCALAFGAADALVAVDGTTTTVITNNNQQPSTKT
jgi:hypothetical protein